MARAGAVRINSLIENGMKNSGFHFCEIHTHTHTMDSSSRVNKNRRTASRYTCVFVEFIQRKRYNVTTARTPNKFQRRHVFTLSRAYGSPPCNRGPPFSDLTFSARKTEFPRVRVYVYVSA